MERKDDSRRRTGSGTSREGRRESRYSGPRSMREDEYHRGRGRAQSGSRPRQSSAVHSRKRRRRQRRNRILKTIGILLLLVVIGIGAYGYKLFSSMDNVAGVDIKKMANPNLSVDTIKNMKKYWTIAVFGVDAREGEGLGKGVRSDVIMICNIERKTGDIKLVSVYRDTYAQIDSKKYGKINEAYFRGGPEMAIEALNNNFDLQIDDYITFNWKAVIDAINILDGVDLEVTDKEFKYINAFITETVNETGVGSYQLKSPGMQHLDGVQAVAYSRLRLMDTDFQRTERQRKVIQLCMDKAKKADFATLNNILVTVLGQVSSSFEVGDLVPLAQNVANYNIAETTGFPFNLKDIYIGKQDCVVPVTLYDNVTQLHAFLYGEEGYEPSSSVKTISVAIEDKSGLGKSAASTTTQKSSTKVTSTAAEKAASKKETTAAAKESTSEKETTSVDEAEKNQRETTSQEAGESRAAEGTEETKETSTKEAALGVSQGSQAETGKETATESTKNSTKGSTEKENEQGNAAKESTPSQTDAPKKPVSTGESGVTVKVPQSQDNSGNTEKTGNAGTTQNPGAAKETTSNVFTEKPTAESTKAAAPEGPGKVGGSAGVSEPGAYPRQ